MNVEKWLIGDRKVGDHREERVIWGNRLPKSLKYKYTIQAKVLRVPTYALVDFVLTQWLDHNASQLLQDEQARSRLGEYLEQNHRANSKRKGV